MSEAYPTSPFQAAEPTAKKESWKSQAFINCYHTATNGKKRKVFSVPLKANVKAERDVINHLQADPSPENIHKFFAMLEIDFQMVKEDDGANVFDFSS